MALAFMVLHHIVVVQLCLADVAEPSAVHSVALSISADWNYVAMCGCCSFRLAQIISHVLWWAPWTSWRWRSAFGACLQSLVCMGLGSRHCRNRSLCSTSWTPVALRAVSAAVSAAAPAVDPALGHGWPCTPTLPNGLRAIQLIMSNKHTVN